jgi:hypothetical protein
MMYAILESRGEDLEIEMLNETAYVLNPDGSVMIFDTFEEASSYAMANCAGDFEVVPY